MLGVLLPTLVVMAVVLEVLVAVTVIQVVIRIVLPTQLQQLAVLERLGIPMQLEVSVDTLSMVELPGVVVPIHL